MTLFSFQRHKTRKFSFSSTLPKLMPDLAEFMTTDEAAQALGYNVQSVRRMVRNKILSAHKFGRFMLVSKNSVKKYAEETREMSKNDPRRGQIQ